MFIIPYLGVPDNENPRNKTMNTHTKTRFNKDRFTIDNKLGSYGELAVTAFLRQQNRFVISMAQLRPNRPFPDYDLISINPLNGKKTTIEIKTDSKPYPNVPIAIFDSSKPASNITLPNWEYSCNAGIYKSRADTFMVYSAYYKKVYVAERQAVIDYLTNNPNLLKRERRDRTYTEFSGIALIPRNDWGELGDIWDVSELIPDGAPSPDNELTLKLRGFIGSLGISTAHRVG